LFGLVDPVDMERRALTMVTTADRLEQEAEDSRTTSWLGAGWPPWASDISEES
jgi:hypothetical protein